MTERCAEKKKNQQKTAKNWGFSTAVMPDFFFYYSWRSGMSVYKSKTWKEQEQQLKKGATELFAAVQQQVTRAN